MVAKNDITGDLIKTKPSAKYVKQWAKIFGKKRKKQLNKPRAARGEQDVL